MNANVSALRVRGKAKRDRRANASNGGIAAAARSRGARRQARRPIPIASGSPKCCCSRRPPRRRRPIIRPSSPNGRGSRIWPPPPVEAVISAFAGLGYYSRARNLHACAKEIARRGGRFPSEEAELARASGRRRLYRRGDRGDRLRPPDRARSTAISRAFWRGSSPWKSRSLEREGEIATAARALAPSRRAGDFAQALMDIGAMICRPRNPDCAHCPLAPGLRGVPDRRLPRPIPGAPRRRQAVPAGSGVLRSSFRRRLSRPPPPAARPSRLDSRTAGHAVDERRRSREGSHSAAPVAARWRRLPGDSRAGLHSFRAETDGLRGGVRRRRSGGPFLGRAATRSARRDSRT